MKQSKTVAQLEKKVATIKNHKKWYKKLLKELKKLGKLEKSLQEQKASSKNLKKDYKNRLEELEDAYSRIATLNEDINVLKGTMKQDEEAFEIEIHELKNAHAECGQEKEALTQKIETLSAAGGGGGSEKLKAKNDELKDELKAAKKSAKKSAKELEKLEAALAEAQANCGTAEGKVADLEEVAETATLELEVANATISDLQDDHMRLTEPDGAEIEVANATISDLQDDHMRLTEPVAEAATPEAVEAEEEVAETEEATPEAVEEPVVEAKPKSKKEEALERIKEKAKDIDFDRIGAATAEEKDDLQRMKGIGPYIENKLNALGIFTFKQIANFTDEDKDLVNNAIEFFPGRIKRDDWVGQATELIGKE